MTEKFLMSFSNDISAELQKQLALKTIYDKELVNRTEEGEISETIKLSSLVDQIV